MTRPAREGPVKSHLERLIGQYGRQESLAVGRVRRWISTMALLGALERIQRPDGGPRFVLKGGVAIELRLRAGARATQDIDMTFHGPSAQLIEALDDALARPYRDFAFQRSEPIDRNPQAQTFDVRLSYQTRAWGTLRLEISGPDLSDGDFELLPAISLEDFQLSGPTEIACLPLRYQIAQKLHALTEEPADRENRRFRDLLDLLLLRELIDDLSSLRRACEATFAHRATHPWPPQLNAPRDSWRAGYTQLATDVGLNHADIDHAISEVQDLINEIARA